MTPRAWTKFLGYSQVALGLLGLGILPFVLRNPNVPHPLPYILGSLIYLGLVTIAGLFLLIGRSWGVPLSAWVQLPQLVWVATPGFLIQFICGFMVLLQITPDTMMFRFGFQTGAWLGHNPGPAPHLIAINFFPLIALRGLWVIAHAPKVQSTAPEAASTIIRGAV